MNTGKERIFADPTGDDRNVEPSSFLNEYAGFPRQSPKTTDPQKGRESDCKTSTPGSNPGGASKFP
jgi:hypothetical protein